MGDPMAISEKEPDKENMAVENDERESYELLAESELAGLRSELKKAKEFEVTPTKRLHVSLNELNAKLDRLIGIFDEASRDIKIEEGSISFQEKMRPLIEKMNKILEQNSEIAEGIVALADIVKDFQEGLETKGVVVADKQESPSFGQPPVFPSVPLEPKPFPPRLPPARPLEQMQRVAPPPFEIVRPPTTPPPLAPPKKRLFGL